MVRHAIALPLCVSFPAVFGTFTYLHTRYHFPAAVAFASFVSLFSPFGFHVSSRYWIVHLRSRFCVAFLCALSFAVFRFLRFPFVALFASRFPHVHFACSRLGTLISSLVFYVCCSFSHSFPHVCSRSAFHFCDFMHSVKPIDFCSTRPCSFHITLPPSTFVGLLYHTHTRSFLPFAASFTLPYACCAVWVLSASRRRCVIKHRLPGLGYRFGCLACLRHYAPFYLMPFRIRHLFSRAVLCDFFAPRRAMDCAQQQTLHIFKRGFICCARLP